MAEPVRAGDVLGTLPGLAKFLAEARLLRAWPELAGPAASRTRAEHVDAGILHVAVDSSGWLHRLALQEADLLARCRAITAIRGIRFHLAPVEAPSTATSGASDPARPAAPPLRAQGEVPP